MTLEEAMKIANKFRLPENTVGPGTWPKHFYWYCVDNKIGYFATPSQFIELNFIEERDAYELSLRDDWELHPEDVFKFKLENIINDT